MQKKFCPPHGEPTEAPSDPYRQRLTASASDNSSQYPPREHGRSLLLNVRQTAELYGVSERTFHAMRSQGLVPAAVCLGERTLRWSRAEVEQAIRDLPRQVAGSAEPVQLRTARERRGRA